MPCKRSAGQKPRYCIHCNNTKNWTNIEQRICIWVTLKYQYFQNKLDPICILSRHKQKCRAVAYAYYSQKITKLFCFIANPLGILSFASLFFKYLAASWKFSHSCCPVSLINLYLRGIVFPILLHIPTANSFE